MMSFLHLILRFIEISVTYIFTAPTCTTIIITLEPCALNDEFLACHTEIY
jgi:hypothetical protein